MSATVTTSAPKDKRARRTNAEMENLLESVFTILGEYNEPITIRHLFYRLASDLRVIEKTEKAYSTLRGHLAKWRKQRIIPFSKFTDATRFHYGSEVFDDLEEYLQHCAQYYRMNLWHSADYYPELWCEKDAAAQAIHRIADEWNLKTFVGRGDPSMSSLHNAAKTFNAHRRQGKIPVILYLGDYDENGLAIPKTILRNLKKDHDCDVELVNVAVRLDHIERFDLPTRPAKGARRGEEIDRAVELDVLKPAMLRELLSAEIEKLIPADMLYRNRMIEEAERETLAMLKIETLTIQNQ